MRLLLPKGIYRIMAEVFVSPEKIKALASGGIDGLKDSTDMQEVFAACFAASKERLGLTPYDEQLLAAAELTKGRIIEMKTGEGKTLCAAFAACYMAKNGRNVRVLTFNDYLAKRDSEWMKPIYDALGLSSACITHSTDTALRKQLYKSQILYITAREAGFDFLRDFVANSPDDCVQTDFDFCIADEADSMMIDEARVPLVIAGETAVTPDEKLPEVYEFVKDFDSSMYEINEELGTIYLTPKGEDKCEELLTDGSGLYDEENNEFLTRVTDCLRACFLLKKDVDYIVKDEKIRIIDEFTGRAAKNRRYPGLLQPAVELKEGITATSRGVIMGIIPMQFYLRRYPLLSGMTGTAKSSEDEFWQLYDLKVTEIPTHTPCKRIDHPYEVYFTKAAKDDAVVRCIKSAHAKNQPVLVGTPSIEESEALSARLEAEGITASVLNAKNDELEAEIIKEAGRLGAVTISANMSGRGVDIRLGGSDESQHDEVVKAGGLLILGTFMSESERGDMQLRGRSGRQGDVGESRFIISLEDEIMTKYEIKKLIPKKHYPTMETGRPIDDKAVLREVNRIQRIAQGDTLELRKRLLKFTMIGEKHRDAVFGRRRAFLTGESKVDIWQTEFTDSYNEAVAKFGEEKVNELQKRVILQVINEYWSDYLDYTSYLRDGIHLTRIGGKNPADEYNIVCEEFFSGMEEQVIDAMGERLEQLLALDSADDYVISVPTELWTYTLNESGEELLKKSFIETVLSEEEEESYYGEDDYEEQEEETKDNKPAKKGFFAKLFGKKD